MPDVEKILDRLPKSRRAVRIALAVLIAVVFALIGVLFWQVHENAGKLADASAVSRARGQALGTANAKLTQNGIPAVQPTKAKPEPGNTELGPTTPSSTPKAERGRQGETGPAGPGPSTAQVENAVTDYCAAHSGCANGPTKAQVAAAVLTYCTSKDDCQGDTGPAGQRGLPGATGATGKPGASGSPGASGEPGRAPTTDEISDAVAAYCADGACRGPKGDTGDTGPAGPAGPAGQDGANGTNGTDGKNAPTFTKIECTDSNSWLFTLSDGTTLTAAGPCRASTTTVTVTAPPSSPQPSSTAP